MTKNSNFYYDLEANFRGTREEITGRLKVYLPFVAPIFAGKGTQHTIDLGCGRGEWLELMASLGAEAFGVDLDDGMLQDCFSRNLKAENKDAIEALKALGDNSIAIVSGFHIAEHLPFDVLLALVEEAYRVLQPGGLLILETPNAENVSVGSHTFHFDPTHVNPLPPGLLSYLPRREGFVRSQVIRLQENKTLREGGHVRLLDVFQGVSPDYAVVAQKDADADYMAQFDAAFAADYGLTIETLTRRFEEGFAGTIQHSMNEIQQSIQELRQQNDDYQHRLTAVYESTSWRITAPLRRVVTLVKGGKQVIKGLLKRAILLVLSTPLLKKVSAKILHRFPGIRSQLKRVLLGGPAGAVGSVYGKGGTGYFQGTLMPEQLSPKTENMYKILKDKLGDKAR